jgi:two-component system, chemotaxis family, protein-glutamate methylesterase/glutaminase
MAIIKVLIVDDSAVVRQTYKMLLESDPEIVVIGTAGDPYIAAQKIQKEKPDVITLDIEMPRMDGLTFLKKLMNQAPMPVVVISNQTLNGADAALRALEAGAIDVMAKPNLSNESEIRESGITLIDKIRSAFFSKGGKVTKNVTDNHNQCGSGSTGIFSPHSLIAVGASTGGTEAIRTLLQGFSAQIPPVLIVQHMPEKFTASFANRLNDVCAPHVKEAAHGEVILPGNVYIAPGGRHMALAHVNGKQTIKIYDGELVNRHRPSVNVLFNSVAEVKGRHAVGIILTGMGDDGASGMLEMNRRGAYTIAQDEATSVVYGMPYKAALMGGASKILPLHEIALNVCQRLSEYVAR